MPKTVMTVAVLTLCRFCDTISKKKRQAFQDLSDIGAGDGNRTRVSGLGSVRSAIELHLHIWGIYGDI